MATYGYIEDGYLRARSIEETIETYKDENGQPQQRTVTVEEQLSRLSDIWKPVDDIDETKLTSEDADYIIVPRPYDAGDHIAYEYERKFDAQKVRMEIETLKDTLTASDYKVIKCYEASLTGESMPYDVEPLHTERQELRDRINELQSKL